MLSREQLIAIARGIGWDVQKESGKIAEYWTVSNATQSYDYPYLSDFDAWNFVISQMTGDIPIIAPDESNTAKHERLLNEMISYTHPSLLQEKSRGLSRGNVYAWHERREGHKPVAYSMSIGLEVATGGHLPIAFYVLKVEAKDFSAESRERAIEQLYQQFQEWIVTQKPENPMTWSLREERR